MFRAVAKDQQHAGREHLLDDLLFPPVVRELVFGNQREIARRVAKQDRSKPLDKVPY
jgi:hypothetical protein